MSEPEPAERAAFDSRAFFRALDAERLSRRLTWKDVAQQAGISASTLSRMSQGRRPDVDGLATLLSWSGLEATPFIRASQSVTTPSTLARISTELRSDPLLTDETASALEDIVRTAYERLAARDAREGSETSRRAQPSTDAAEG